MKTKVTIAFLLLAAASANAAIIWEQPPNTGNGSLLQSSRWDPDGSDWDQYVWDNFIPTSAAPITKLTWRGGYAYDGGFGGHVIDFEISIWPSIAAGTQPNVVRPPLAEYRVGGNAGETPAGVFGGKQMFDYQYTLPTDFRPTAGTQYWVQIEAWHHGIPEWGLARAIGGDCDGHYFRCISGQGDRYYQHMSGDAAFTLHAAGPALGDLNCDGAFDGGDIDPFLLALGDPGGYAALFPDCDAALADMNADGGVDGADIDMFFLCLGGACQ